MRGVVVKIIDNQHKCSGFNPRPIYYLHFIQLTSIVTTISWLIRCVREAKTRDKNLLVAILERDGFVDNPADREKRNLSSLKPEDLLPESPEIKRNLQHQSVSGLQFIFSFYLGTI
ncbi:hypothetical protein O3M35_000746 [Rhynocoris fuscipes]|uniref:Uncharacterized protein n=1 Tax=Rhynocoris fuscipes TaxID=488301 RepID=A0AAW1DS61_9HEMI